MNPSNVLPRLAETVVNRALRLDPDTRRRLGEFDGRCLRVRLASANDVINEFDLLPSEAGLRIEMADAARQPDVTFSGTTALFRLALFGEGARDVEISIRGDVALGNRFRAVVEGIDIDWEEGLSHVTGDAVAHAVGRAARDFRMFLRDGLEVFRRDAAEFLQEESGLLARREDVGAFLDAVNALRADADRLDRRLARLEAR